MSDKNPGREEIIRTKARVHGWTSTEVINNIESVDTIDFWFIEWCRAIKADLLPGLMQIMLRERGEAQLRASLLLLHLGESVGTDGIIACLLEDDSEFQIRVLSSLSILPLEDSPMGWEVVVPIKKEALLDALKPLLKLPADPRPLSLESRSQFLAINNALRLDLPQAEQFILPFLQNGSARVRSSIISYLSRHSEDKGALAAAKEMLQEDSEIYSVVSSLETYCKSQDPYLSQRAASLLIDFVHMNMGRSGNDITNHLWHALDGIVAVQHPQRERVLKEVLAGPVKDWRRGIALRHLAELEGDAGLDRLREALIDPGLRQFAAEGIAAGTKGKNDRQLVDALVATAHQEDRPHVLAKLLDALIALNADMNAIPEEIAKRLEPNEAMRLYWLANNVTPRIAAEKLVGAGVIPSLSEELLLGLDKEWEQQRLPHLIMFSLLRNQTAWFDTESGLPTPDYLELTTQFLAISQDVFKADAFTQTIDDASGDSVIRFVFDGNIFTFTAQNLGDWYDVRAITTGFNQALADSGQPRRFLSLYTGDQSAAIVFAPETDFRQVASILHFTLEEDPEAAMNRGVAFEKKVHEELKRQERRQAQSQQSFSWRQRLLRRLQRRNGRQG